MTANGLRPTLRNVATVARREYLWRGRSRSFIISTLFLVVVAVAVALAPTIVRFINRLGTAETIAVYSGAVTTSIDYAPALEALMNSTAATGTSGGTDTETEPFTVTDVTDLATARADVGTGELKAVLALERSSAGDIGYTLYTDMMPFERTVQLIQQAATALTVQDRLTQAGVPPGDQGALFAPTTFEIVKADPAAAAGSADTVEQLIGGSVIGFALTIFIFMAIIVYGQWVAMSVVEEKSSRVMEIVLGAAKPIELLSGKVVGVGGLGLTQYVAIFIPAVVAIIFQRQIASLVLGGEASIDLPSGLTVPVLIAFGVFFVLGFALYATLFAGVASLVSRQEDVSQLISPLILVATLGYLIAVYSSSGLIPIDSPLVIVLSFVPFLTPYLMLTRMTITAVQPWEPILAAVILAISVVVALWVAARLYSAGVLMYGQKPGFRALIRAFRTA
jgi:ABC-2 type transport system permease protein